MRRDLPAYFMLYDDACRTALGFGPDQGVDFGDGLGPVHAREGYVWRLIRMIEAACPGQRFDPGPAPKGSSYRNWSIGGTTSKRGIAVGVTPPKKLPAVPHGLHPVRVSAMRADIIPGATLVIVGFGQNELGDQTTYANLVRIAKKSRKAGAEVLFISATRPDTRFGDRIDGFHYTCAETVRAAIDTRSAVIDMSELVSPANLVGLGLAEREICDASLMHHEGVPVQQAIARRAAEILL